MTDTVQVTHPDPLPLVRVSGTHRNMGRQIGEACSLQVRRSLENARKLIESSYATLELTWAGAQIQARKYIPFVQERYPHYIEEMTGIAEGADVPIDDIIVLNAMEAVTMDALHLYKCTSLAINDQLTADGHILIAHNEDWLPEDEDDIYLIHATPDDEPAFLAMTYGGNLPNVGFNALGIAQCCDTVYPTDSRIGIPRIFVSRAVLAAQTLGEAISRTLVPHRAAGYNHLIAHESGELYNVEVSARRFAILYGQDGYVVHTNFYLDPGMQAIEYEPDELINTRIRYYRALRLLTQSEQHTIKTLEAIQRDHINYPNSICDHLVENTQPLDRQKTINALIIDLTAKAMHVVWGNPCMNNYHTYYLES